MADGTASVAALHRSLFDLNLGSTGFGLVRIPPLPGAAAASRSPIGFNGLGLATCPVKLLVDLARKVGAVSSAGEASLTHAPSPEAARASVLVSLQRLTFAATGLSPGPPISGESAERAAARASATEIELVLRGIAAEAVFGDVKHAFLGAEGQAAAAGNALSKTSGAKRRAINNKFEGL